MKVKLGQSGVALVMVLATSTAIVPAAHATTSFTAEQYPAVLTGQSNGTTNFIGFTCANVTFEATFSEATPSITLTPHITTCDQPFAFTLDMNGCHYVLEALSATSTEDVHGRLKVACPVGQKIALTYGDCTASIPPQTAGAANGEVTLANNGGSIELKLNVESLHVETKGFFFCGTATHTTSPLASTSTLTGYEDEGTQEGKTISRKEYLHGAPLDVHVK